MIRLKGTRTGLHNTFFHLRRDPFQALNILEFETGFLFFSIFHVSLVIWILSRQKEPYDVIGRHPKYGNPTRETCYQVADLEESSFLLTEPNYNTSNSKSGPQPTGEQCLQFLKHFIRKKTNIYPVPSGRLSDRFLA